MFLVWKYLCSLSINKYNIIKLFSNLEPISTTKFPNKPPESPKPKKTLDEAFEDCFEAWGVDTDSGNKSFGLWKDKGNTSYYSSLIFVQYGIENGLKNLTLVCLKA